MKKRPVLFVTIAVVLSGAAGATSVFYIGSRQQQRDREAFVAYERSVAAVTAVVQLIEQEIRSGIGDLETLAEWRTRLMAQRSTLASIRPPEFLRRTHDSWLSWADALLRSIERLIRGESDAKELRTAEDFHVQAARGITFHRKRLGLDDA